MFQEIRGADGTRALSPVSDLAGLSDRFLRNALAVNFRHSRAHFLINKERDAKTVQGLLRQADVSTALQLYARSVNFVHDGSAAGNFAERFERGKLRFTGDVSQVRSVIGCPQKFGKLLKQFVVGA